MRVGECAVVGCYRAGGDGGIMSGTVVMGGKKLGKKHKGAIKNNNKNC